MPSTHATTHIPLVDLVAQYASLRDELDAAWREVVSEAAFTLGQHTEAFEREFARYCGSQHAVGVSSGTAALSVALQALGVGPGDVVMTSPLTFFATVEAIRSVGASPVFADVDAETYCIDPQSVEQAWTPAVKAMIPVHLYGHPAPMSALHALAKARDCLVVEDAAQAHGAHIDDRRVGSWGNLGCFSFYPSKNLGAYGDAGLVTTDDPTLLKTLQALRDHGREDRHRHRYWSGNHRMDDLQAKILSVKLARLDAWTDARRSHAAAYTERLRGVVLKTPSEQAGAYHVYHLYVVEVDARDELLNHLREAGIGAAVHYRVPVHLQPACAELGVTGSCPVAERIVGRVLSLPLYAEMTADQIDYVCDAVRSFYGRS